MGMRVFLWIVLALVLCMVIVSVAAIVAGKILSSLDEGLPTEPPREGQPLSIKRLFRWASNHAANVWEVLYLAFVTVWALSRRSPGVKNRPGSQQASSADAPEKTEAKGPPAGDQADDPPIRRLGRRARRSQAAGIGDRC